MKNLITATITLSILIGITLGFTFLTNTNFIDYAFFIGLTISVIIWFFSSKGGSTSNHLDNSIQGTTGLRIEKQEYQFSPNVVFYSSIAYTILTFLLSLIYYQVFK